MIDNLILITPFLFLWTVAVAAIAYRAGKAREHMNTAGRIIAAKAEAFERGRQSVQTFDMDAMYQQSADPEFQAVDKDETPISKQL